MRQYQIRASSAAELVRDVEAAVANGHLRPGERLPSVRRLAVELGLSPGTVAAGLAELRRRGAVVTEPRRGTRIGEAPPVGASRMLLPVPPGARDLSSGNPDPALLPDLKQALAGLSLPTRLYGEPAIVAELGALAAEQLRADGIPSDALCVVSGALDGIAHVLEARLRPGDRVAVENPGYAELFNLLRARGLVLEAVGVDRRGMRARDLRAALQRGARAAIITPRGQNPTGAALDAERASELRAVLDDYPEALVVEDDHLWRADASKLHSTVSGRGSWAAVRSVAKALGPDVRLAIMAGDPLTVARVEGRQRCGPGWVSHILQRLVLALWSDAEVQALVQRASSTYARRRERLLACLEDVGVSAQGSSGLNVWIPVSDETGVVGALLQRGWVVAPGGPYRLAGSNPAIRVTIATLSSQEAARLAGDLAGLLAAGRATRAG